MEDKFEIMKKYANYYKPERFTYLIISILVFIALLFFIGYQFWSRESDTAQIISLMCAFFGTGGILTYSISQLFKFMDKVDENIEKYYLNKPENNQ